MNTQHHDTQSHIKRLRLRNTLVILSTCTIAIGALLAIGSFNSSTYANAWTNAIRLLSEFLPADFSRASYWWQPALETCAMACAGTALACASSLPLACFAARNCTPHPSLAYLLRCVFHILRSIPDLLWAVLLCVAFGAGPFAGMLALCLHSIGALGKQYSEHIEHAAIEPIMAIRSSGAGPITVISHGILTQVQGLLSDASFYRLEINIRMATVLGFVGAGGLGQEILGSMRILAYPEVAAQVICLILLVALIDIVSAFMRKRITL